MRLIDLKKILYMDFLIQHRCTGSPCEFAKKLSLSRSTLFEYLAYMREELEVHILYDRGSGTYYYSGTTLYAAIKAQTGITN